MAIGERLPAAVSVFLLGGMLCGFGAPPSSAFKRSLCDRRLKPAPGAIGYTWRGNRCEGFYESPISAPALSVVSVLIGKIAFSLQDEAPLALEAPSCHEGPVSVRAMSLRARTYYRMDAEIAAHDRLAWPINDILRRAQLQPSVLGAYGFEQKDQKTLYLPLRIHQPGREAAPSADDVVSVAVRTGTALETVKWRIVDRGMLKKDWHTATHRPVPAQAVVRFDVPLENPGVATIEMAAKERATDSWSTLRFRLLLCPQSRS
ncbi:MAG: hypothetical protein AAF449_01465 [Myxococcota bacterium]